MNWTDEQYAAVFGEKTNCLVSAAAGSGKTQVLTGRILRRVMEENIDINRILVVTFTNAAAAEMRERIGKSLSEALKENPDNMHLRRQLSLLGSANIQTMDAFCLQLIRTYFLEAGVDAAFRIADSTETAILKAEAAEEALEEMYKKGDSDFLAFAECYSRMKDDSVLCDMVTSLYNFAESMPEPMEWLREKAEMYRECATGAFEDSIYAKTVLENIRREIAGLSERCFAAERNFSASQSFSEAFRLDGEGLRSILKAEDWDAMKEAMDTISWARRQKEPDKELATMADAVRKELKKEYDKIFSYITYSKDVAARIMGEALPHVIQLTRYAEVFHAIYAEKKREKNLLDYSDLEHFAIRLLSEKTENGYKLTPIAEALREKYDEIYIDEYQDSNDVQELLFTSISGESKGKPNMFMVGDMKQSIYGFRKTSPALFIRKSETYGKGGENRKVHLSRNFRSRPEVLSFVNHVCKKLLCREIGGIQYTKEEQLNPGGEFPSPSYPAAEILIAESEGNAKERMQAEAELIASKIQEMVGTDVYDGKTRTWRKVRYGDIAVIMRSAKDMATPLMTACQKREIPLYSDLGGGYFETVEITVFLALLKTIDNPQNDIPLLATMRAPFFRFSEEELAKIRLRDRKSLFYKALTITAQEETPLGHKCQDFLKKLRAWRRMSAYLATDTLILRLFEETGYLLFVSGQTGGEMKRANLQLLFEKAHQFEKTSFRGLFHFLSYMERLKSKSEDIGEAKLLGEGENVVRLMSIHKSKGLEFPIVFLAGTARPFNKKSVQGNFILHKDLGIGLSHIDPKKRIKYDTPAKTAVLLKRSCEERGEELRVLYVALTRAKERLIITGAQSLEAFEKARKGGLSPSEILHADSFLTLILRAVSDVDIPVSLWQEEPEEQEEKEEKKLMLPLPPSERVRKILEFSYPRPELRDIPSKISVSEYKRLIEENDTITFPLYKETALRTPRFRSLEGNIRGASFGTLMHFIMQGFPYEAVRSREEIRQYIESLAQKKIISPMQAEAVDKEKLFRFWDGEMGHRIRRAEKVYREMPFTQTVPASLLTKDKKHLGEKIVIQGIIDCFFFEKGKIVLLDYKTDALAPENVIRERYKVQLDCYQMAIEQKYFSEISQKVIYLFANNGIIVVD